MQVLTLFMLVVVTTVQFLTKGDFWGDWAVLPSASPLLAEILGAVALVIVVLLGSRNRFRYVRPEYWLLFGGLAVVAFCGVLANNVEPGTAFAGMRTYLRALPWFFIPAVYAFSEKQIRTQLKLLLGICMIQIAFSVHQFIRTEGKWADVGFTGDWISGTLMTSSMMSVFLIGATCIATGLLLRKRITLRQFVGLFALLLFPTTINETKGTLLLLPLGLMVVLLVGTGPKLRSKYALVTALLVGGFLAVFVPIYDNLVSSRANPTGITEYFTEPDTLERYLRKGRDVGTTERAGRIDSIVVSAKFIARDPVSLMFGLGIGNASDSALGQGFAGRYFDLLRPFLLTGFSRIVLELGVIGFALLTMIYWSIFSDVRIVARRSEGLVGAIGAGWGGITIVMFVVLFYKDVVNHASLSFLFWYLSGLVAAQRVRAWASSAHDKPLVETLHRDERAELSRNSPAARSAE